MDDSIIINKRIKREMDFLVRENICDDTTISIVKSDDTEFIIKFQDKKSGKIYHFITPNNYPFVPPKIHINNKPLQFYHHFTNNEFRKSLIKHTGIDCFCCDSILCKDNWQPNFTFKDILNDIYKFRDAVRVVVYNVIIEVIKRKYLKNEPNINIIEWLV